MAPVQPFWSDDWAQSQIVMGDRLFCFWHDWRQIGLVEKLQECAEVFFLVEDRHSSAISIQDMVTNIGGSVSQWSRHSRNITIA